MSNHAIVLDVGKTMAKLSLWSASGRLVKKSVRPNVSVDVKIGGETCRALDVMALDDWILETLSEFADLGAVTDIIPVSHGAGFAVLKEGKLAYTPLDYEAQPPESVMADYRKQRDDFAQTGSPALPQGLNLGAQLHWLETLEPEAFANAVWVSLPQYFAWRLGGRPACEMTSLGCHTDLWQPGAASFSTLSRVRGWSDSAAEIARADAVLGHLRPEIAETTGLPPNVQIRCGLHDSNAALEAARGHPEISDSDATILSTGTWFIAMRSLADGASFDTSQLPEARDCLINVDWCGRPVPSARFMGGREIEHLAGLDDTRRIDIRPDQPKLIESVAGVVASSAMVLPGHSPGAGPFPDAVGGWANAPDDWFSRRAAVCLYAALMADVMLELIGTRDVVLIEGRFAEADVFVRGLATLRPDLTVYKCHVANDVSFGALRLVYPDIQPTEGLVRVLPLDVDLAAYKTAWRQAVETRGASS